MHPHSGLVISPFFPPYFLFGQQENVLLAAADLLVRAPDSFQYGLHPFFVSSFTSVSFLLWLKISQNRRLCPRCFPQWLKAWSSCGPNWLPMKPETMACCLDIKTKTVWKLFFVSSYESIQLELNLTHLPIWLDEKLKGFIGLNHPGFDEQNHVAKLIGLPPHVWLDV